MTGEAMDSEAGHATSATLVSAICFVMGLFYLTGSSDQDLRKYTYQTICQTISIFCAVLIFSAFNDMVETYLLEGRAQEDQVLIDMAHFLCWYVALQTTLAFISGAVDIMNILTGRPERHPDVKTMENNLYSVAYLLSHMTGFASINAWGSLQQCEFFRSGPLHSLAVLPVAIAGQCMLQVVTDKIRRCVSLSDDNEVDSYELLWDEATKESENDVMSLTVSFLLVQSLRFFIGGVLPDQEGNEAYVDLSSHSPAECGLLYAFGFAFLTLSAFCIYAEVLHLHVPHFVHRLLEVFLVTFSMSYAWCIFFGTRWWLASLSFMVDHMLRSVANAAIMSLGGFSLIVLLDKLADADFTSERVDRVIIAIIGWIGILVGFAWEQCFDSAVVSLATLGATPLRQHFLRLCVALFCAVVVAPAWKWWMLPMILEEGWRVGFVVEEDASKWMELLKHMQHVKKSNTERREHLPEDHPQRAAYAWVLDSALEVLIQHAEDAKVRPPARRNSRTSQRDSGGCCPLSLALSSRQRSSPCAQPLINPDGDSVEAGGEWRSGAATEQPGRPRSKSNSTSPPRTPRAMTQPASRAEPAGSPASRGELAACRALKRSLSMSHGIPVSHFEDDEARWTRSRSRPATDEDAESPEARAVRDLLEQNEALRRGLEEEQDARLQLQRQYTELAAVFDRWQRDMSIN